MQIRIRPKAIETEAQKQYIKVFEPVRKDKFLEQKEKQENEKKKAEVDRNILETRPDERLKGLVSGVIKEVAREEKNEEADCDMLSGSTPSSEQETVEQAAEVCATLKGKGGGQIASKQASRAKVERAQPNGPSPGGAQGQSSKGATTGARAAAAKEAQHNGDRRGPSPHGRNVEELAKFGAQEEPSRRAAARKEGQVLRQRRSLEGAAQNRRRSLLKGATVEDLAFMIAHEELRKHVFVYNRTTRSADYLAAENSCWPIEWQLARYHRRHFLWGRGLPEIAPQRKRVNKCVNELRWRAYFSTGVKGPKEKEERKIIKKIQHRSTPRCGE